MTRVDFRPVGKSCEIYPVLTLVQNDRPSVSYVVAATEYLLFDPAEATEKALTRKLRLLFPLMSTGDIQRALAKFFKPPVEKTRAHEPEPVVRRRRLLRNLVMKSPPRVVEPKAEKLPTVYGIFWAVWAARREYLAQGGTLNLPIPAVTPKLLTYKLHSPVVFQSYEQADIIAKRLTTLFEANVNARGFARSIGFACGSLYGADKLAGMARQNELHWNSMKSKGFPPLFLARELRLRVETGDPQLEDDVDAMLEDYLDESSQWLVGANHMTGAPHLVGEGRL